MHSVRDATSLSKKHAIEKYRAAREAYKPKRIRVLFIAESPPSSGGYFYFPLTLGKDHLFRETIKALRLWPVNRKMSRGLDKSSFLAEFQAKGFYLVDTCLVPVDDKPDRERRQMVEESIPKLVGDVKELDPDSIAIVKASIYSPVRNGLEQAGLGAKVLNRGPLPFPSHGNQAKYRRELGRLISGKV